MDATAPSNNYKPFICVKLIMDAPKRDMSASSYGFLLSYNPLHRQINLLNLLRFISGLDYLLYIQTL